MTEIQHSVRCCQTWAEHGQRFDDDCPACRIMKAGPKLLDACKALMSIARYYPGNMNPTGDAEIDVAYNLGKVAIAEAALRMHETNKPKHANNREDNFTLYLKKASEEVQSWPVWKQTALGIGNSSDEAEPKKEVQT